MTKDFILDALALSFLLDTALVVFFFERLVTTLSFSFFESEGATVCVLVAGSVGFSFSILEEVGSIVEEGDEGELLWEILEVGIGCLLSNERALSCCLNSSTDCRETEEKEQKKEQRKLTYEMK